MQICAYCGKKHKPLFTLIRHFTLGKKYKVYFCSYDCLLQDTLQEIKAL